MTGMALIIFQSRGRLDRPTSRDNWKASGPGSLGLAGTGNNFFCRNKGKNGDICVVECRLGTETAVFRAFTGPGCGNSAAIDIVTAKNVVVFYRQKQLITGCLHHLRLKVQVLLRGVISLPSKMRWVYAENFEISMMLLLGAVLFMKSV